MNKSVKLPLLPLLVLTSGTVGALLQLWLLRSADETGLLPGGHIAQILLWILTAAIVLFLIFKCLPLVQAPKYSFNFPSSAISGAGAIIAAAGIGLTALLMLLKHPDTLSLITAIAGLLATAALGLSGYSRWKGTRLSVLFHGMVTLFFLLLLVCQYRLWSAEPQLQTYCFQLLATVCLMIASYQRACFDGDAGQRRSYAFFRLAGSYFCFTALPDSPFWPLYLTAGIWCLTDLCNLTPMRREGR